MPAFPPEAFDPDLETNEYTRAHAWCLIAAGVVVAGFLALLTYLTNTFVGYLLVFAPVLIVVGLAALAEPSVLGALTGQKRTSWRVYLLATTAGFGGLAIGIVLVFHFSGLF